MADYQAELDRWDTEKPNFRRRDELAAEHNRTTDHTERLRLLKRIAACDRALMDHIERTKKLDERQRRVDRLYQEINKDQS